MKRIFIPTQTGSDWQRLLAQPILQWKAGKSAMTAAASWEDNHDTLPKEITEIFDSSLDEDLVGLKLLAAMPEWQVPLAGGEAASQRVPECRNECIPVACPSGQSCAPYCYQECM
jgi:hypothetical protein